MSLHVSLATRLFAVAGMLIAGVVSADPLPGEILKFQQLPQGLKPGPIPGVIFPGHDELSSAYPSVDAAGNTVYQGTYMADDFADTFSTPVVHIRWWGSYLHNLTGQTGAQKFLISFESDVPSDPAVSFSHPGQPLLTQIVTRGPLAPGSGTFTEQQLTTTTNENLYQYNAELNLGKEFFQRPNTVYWLKIVALLDNTDVQWGWHSRDYTTQDTLASTPPLVNPGEFNQAPASLGFPVWHFQDDAVQGGVLINPNTTTGMPVVIQNGWQPQHYQEGTDGPSGISNFSKDLAFELYTVPEPGSLALFGVAGSMLLMRRRREVQSPTPTDRLIVRRQH